MADSIGLDIGHSAVKVACGDQFLFPAAAAPAVDLSVGTASASAKGDTVRVGSEQFFVGETARIHSGGRLVDGLSDDWLLSKEHTALMAAGYQKALRTMGTDEATLVLGLPSRLHGQQKTKLRDEAAANLLIGKENIRVLPQPLAAYYNRVINPDGTPNEAVDADEQWVIIDIGYYTTDFGLVESSIWSAAGQESIAGTHVAARTLKRLVAEKREMEVSTRDAEKILRTGSIRDQGEVIDVSAMVDEAVGEVAKQIIDAAIQIFGNGTIRGAHGVLIAGGGSSLMFDDIKKAWKHAVCAENARFAVAEGMRRFGLASQLVEEE